MKLASFFRNLIAITMFTLVSTPSIASAQTTGEDQDVSIQPLVRRLAELVDRSSEDEESRFTSDALRSPDVLASEAMLNRVVRQSVAYTRRTLAEGHVDAQRLAFGERITAHNASRLAEVAGEIDERVSSLCLAEDGASVCDDDEADSDRVSALCCTPEGSDMQERIHYALSTLASAANELARFADVAAGEPDDNVIAAGLVAAFESRFEAASTDQARASILMGLQRFTLAPAAQARRELREETPAEEHGE